MAQRSHGFVKLPAGTYAFLIMLFMGVALLSYDPSLRGPFVSDDRHYIENNSYVHELSVDSLLVILDPTGPATIGIANYSPMQLILHTIAWKIFGPHVVGHHLVNLTFHVLASLLLIPLFLRSGASGLAAVLGSAFFLVHPANVEAVAWISQLKSSSALALSLVALLAFPKRPAHATAFFALALLAKPMAAYALPVAVLLAWCQRVPIPWKWIAVWGILLAGFSVVEFSAHQRAGAAEAVLYDTPLVLLRTMMALAMRYLVMASTSYGVSAFHEPSPSDSVFDPWWLASVVAISLIGWRAVVMARRREAEFAYWSWALISYGIVSQIFPFLYPFADRYLYFILPGLIGATLLAGGEFLDRLSRAIAAHTGRPFEATRRGVGRAMATAVLLVLLPLTQHSHARAAIWRSGATLVLDAAAHYPEGVSAHLVRANRAAQKGDVDGAVSALRVASERGFNQFEQLLADPALAPLRGHAKFDALISEMALGRIESIEGRELPTQLELHTLARAHGVRGEQTEAVAALRRALAIGGPLDAKLRIQLRQMTRAAP